MVTISIVVQSGINFGNSVLDNSNWNKISQSLTKKSHTCEEGGTHLRIFFWHLLTNFEKAEKSDFWKNERLCWRYHHFTNVYQKSQSYDVQFLRYEVRQNFLSFWTIFCPFNPLPPNNQEILKKWKNHLGMSSFWTCATKNTIIWCILTSACTGIIFCHFRPFFALLPHYWPQKLKFRKDVKEYLEILPFYTCVPLIKIICTPDMMHGSWDMKFNRQNYFVILGNF